VEQERKLPGTEANTAQVDDLKSRYPAMLGLAAAGLGAAALAAEMDEQYVQDLLQDQPPADVEAHVAPELQAELEPEPEPQTGVEEVGEAPATEVDDLDSA
ncbi:hypothetical protein NL393_31535, partial [Klebsiella pneumoniae]|nr:hypothetical protein [Klebsiella pneumoniae]